MKILIQKLKALFYVKSHVKSWDEMTLYEQWQYARDNFQHYALRSIYDYGDGFRSHITQEERNWCIKRANKWDSIIKELRLEIIAQSNVC